MQVRVMAKRWIEELALVQERQTAGLLRLHRPKPLLLRRNRNRRPGPPLAGLGASERVRLRE